MAGGYVKRPTSSVEALSEEIRKLHEKIDNMGRALTGIGLYVDGETRNLVFDSGTGKFRVVDPNTGQVTHEVGVFGFYDGSGRKQGGFGLWRANGGSVALSLLDLGTTPGHPFGQALQWFDKSGNIVVADDANGNGLALPYLPIPFCDSNIASGYAITSGTFSDCGVGASYQMNPNVMGYVIVQSDAVGTTGEVRLLASGTQVGATITVPANTTMLTFIGPAALPGNFRDYVQYNLQARRTAGGGNIRARMVALTGQQA